MIILTLKLQEEDYLRRPAVRLFMPDTLKSILVDDWEKITKEGKLVPLPSDRPVNTFLDDYYNDEMARYASLSTTYSSCMMLTY